MIDLREAYAPPASPLRDLRLAHPAEPMLVARELLEPDDVVAVTFGGYADTYQRVADVLAHAPQLLMPRMWVYPPRFVGT